MAKCFHEAKDYIAVEEEKIAKTLDWIVSHQATNGSFVEPPDGRVCHTAMQVVSVIIFHTGSSRGMGRVSNGGSPLFFLEFSTFKPLEPSFFH